MVELHGRRYDGQTSVKQSVTLSFDETGIKISGENLDEFYSCSDIRLEPRLANIPAQVHFTDGSLCELPEQTGLDEMYEMFHQGKLHGFIHYLENHLVAIASTAIAAVLVIFMLVQFGVPVVAKTIAYRIPIDFENSMGRETLAIIDKTLCDTSQLTQRQQADLKESMFSILDNKDYQHIQVVFRHCEKIGANALALPSGIILFTDDMVNLSQTRDELIGVFAHELGHVEYRHTMRHALQNSIVGLLIVLLTGDVGTLSSMAATLPTILVQTKFSRDFEREADNYAADYMIKVGKDPVHLANILQRLDKEYGKESEASSFMSTHPLTEERVKSLTTIH